MGKRPQGVPFELDKPNNVYRAKAITELCDILRNKKIPFQFNADSSSDRDFRKWEQLEAVKRWFHYDWQRIEPTLRTSLWKASPSSFLCSMTIPT